MLLSVEGDGGLLKLPLPSCPGWHTAGACGLRRVSTFNLTTLICGGGKIELFDSVVKTMI